MSGRSEDEPETPWEGLVDPSLPYEEDVVAQLFVSHFTGGAPRGEVAAALGYSREWVRQIEKEAMEAFRKEFETHGWSFADALLVLASQDPECEGETYLVAEAPGPGDGPTRTETAAYLALREG